MGKDKRPDIVVNAELYKYVGADNTTDEKGRKFSDIVIHGGQHDTNQQLLVCEIKVKASQDDIKADLNKLLDYMDNKKMFERSYNIAVFINVGPLNTFKNHLISLNIKRQGLFFVSYDMGRVYIIDSTENIEKDFKDISKLCMI